jgi:hypothetical protein
MNKNNEKENKKSSLYKAGTYYGTISINEILNK